MAIRFPKEGNPLWPLPADYETLGNEGRRLARINAVALRETPEEDVASWKIFREYYLKDDEEADFRCGWFDNYSEPAPGHYEWVMACAKYKRVILGAHRGSAKSTIFSGEFTLRDVLSIPGHKSLFVNISEEKVMERMGDLMRQLEHNQRIIDDFGNMKTGRGSSGLWNHKQLTLQNGSKLNGTSVTARSIRGSRPHRIIVDDPEYDPRETTNLDKLIAAMEVLLHTDLLPMLRSGCKLHWIGTPIRKKLFLWRIIMGDIPELDPAKWFRKIYPGEDGHLNAFWPDEYPPERILEIRREWGDAYYSEFLCIPGSDEKRCLKIDPTTCIYELKGPESPLDTPTPLASQATIQWHDSTRGPEGSLKITPRELPAEAIFSKMARFVTVDPIRAPSAHSDWAVIHVLGVDGLNQIWSLDLWAGKVRYAALATEVFRMVEKWKPRVIGVESIAMEKEMFIQVTEMAEKFAMREGWVPRILPIRYDTGVKKEDRIQALEWRFARGLVKLPGWLRQTFPYNMLYQQIEDFVPDGTALEHDDAVDTLAMIQEIVKTPRAITAEASPTKTISQMLVDGTMHLPGGIPVVMSCNIQDLPEKTLRAIINRSEIEGETRTNPLLWEGIGL